jgi:hypothetical protein
VSRGVRRNALVKASERHEKERLYLFGVKANCEVGQKAVGDGASRARETEQDCYMFLIVSSQHEELGQKDNRLEPEDEGLDPNILVVHCRSFAFQNSEQSLTRVRHLRFSRILMPLFPNA